MVGGLQGSSIHPKLSPIEKLVSPHNTDKIHPLFPATAGLKTAYKEIIDLSLWFGVFLDVLDTITVFFSPDELKGLYQSIAKSEGLARSAS